jgi:hypothetical protein
LTVDRVFFFTKNCAINQIKINLKLFIGLL